MTTTNLDVFARILPVASKLLVVRLPGQTELGKSALDKALRVVRAVDKIAAALPTAVQPARLDLARVAALYACVPPVPPIAQGGNGHGNGHGAGKASGAGPIVEDVAELAADQLKGKLSEADIDLVIQILREHKRRDAALPEARLLSDACALEDFGLLGFWNHARVAHAAGRSVEQLLKLWQTQKDYGYWESRLNDHFHFEVARSAARRRLHALTPVIEQLRLQHEAADIV